MADFVSYYFTSAEGENLFYPPAKEDQIMLLESQLGIRLPDDYKDFLRVTNGFAGFVNEFYVDFDSVEKVCQSTQQTCAEFFPGMIYIGTDGGLEMFVIDTRKTPFQFGLLPYIGSFEDFIPLGDTFEKFVSRLYDDTVFDIIISL